ncbi:hypothetical protein GINT2_000538 [Glugoides intestinalis]
MVEGTQLIKQYLQNCKSRIKNQKETICLGSEACDPDSFVCSIVTAIHENAIPIICMPKKVFQAKGEIQELCSIFNFSNDDFIFFKRLDAMSPIKGNSSSSTFIFDNEIEQMDDKELSLILVDHHIPIKELRQFKINLIIDHHSLVTSKLTTNRVYLDTDVGSCCTLVSRFIGNALLEKKHPESANFANPLFCEAIAKMLSIPIIFDTNKFKKVTSEFDRCEFKKLRKTAKLKKRAIFDIVKKMKRARHNDSLQSNEIILLKDFKKFDSSQVTFGYATVKYSFEEWIDREAARTRMTSETMPRIAFKSMLREFIERNELDFLIINRKKGSRRYLILVDCPVEKELIATHNFKALDYKGVIYYEVEVEKTRKNLAPIINEMLKTGI